MKPKASWDSLEMKPQKNKGHDSVTLIVSLQALLSKTIDSSQVSLGLPLLLFTLSTRSRTPLRTGVSGGLRWICPNHLSRCCVSFSSIGATPTLSRIASFRTLSDYPSLCARKTTATSASLLHSVARHVAFFVS